MHMLLCNQVLARVVDYDCHQTKPRLRCGVGFLICNRVVRFYGINVDSNWDALCVRSHHVHPNMPTCVLILLDQFGLNGDVKIERVSDGTVALHADVHIKDVLSVEKININDMSLEDFVRAEIAKALQGK